MRPNKSANAESPEGMSFFIPGMLSGFGMGVAYDASEDTVFSVLERGGGEHTS